MEVIKYTFLTILGGACCSMFLYFGCLALTDTKQQSAAVQEMIKGNIVSATLNGDDLDRLYTGRRYRLNVNRENHEFSVMDQNFYHEGKSKELFILMGEFIAYSETGVLDRKAQKKSQENAYEYYKSGSRVIYHDPAKILFTNKKDPESLFVLQKFLNKREGYNKAHLTIWSIVFLMCTVPFILEIRKRLK